LQYFGESKIRSQQTYHGEYDIIHVKGPSKNGYQLQVFINNKHTQSHEANHSQIIGRLNAEYSCYKKVSSAKKPVGAKRDEKGSKEIGGDIKKESNRVIKKTKWTNNELYGPDHESANYHQSSADSF